MKRSFINLNPKALYPVAFIAAALLFFIFTGCSRNQEPRKYVIGYVDPNPEEQEGAAGFLRSMPKQGYTEGVNVSYIKVESKDMQVVEKGLRDMISRRVDLIVTMTTPVTKKAIELAKGEKIPVLFIVYDAVNAGIAKNLADHDSSSTGVQIQGSAAKTLEWLSVISPAARNIFVPVSFDTGAARQSLEKLRQSAGQSGYELRVAEVNTAAELKTALSAMPKKTDAVFMLHSWLAGSHVDEVIAAADRRHIPVISAGHVDYRNGLVMSYAPTDDAVGLQAARLARKILDGTSPAFLPVENAEVYLGINLKAAGRAGIDIPDKALLRADYIIR